MLSISIGEQRKRTPFSNFVWRTDGRGAGGRRDQTKQTKIYYRIVHFYYFKCIRLVLKSKGHARLFSNFVWRTDGRRAGGRRGQTYQTEIYYRIVYFYCVKCLRLVMKCKGKARHFWNCVWLKDERGAGRHCQTSQKKIYEMLPINIEKQRKRPPFLKLCLGTRLSRRKNNIGLFIFTLSNAFD